MADGLSVGGHNLRFFSGHFLGSTDRSGTIFVPDRFRVDTSDKMGGGRRRQSRKSTSYLPIVVLNANSKEDPKVRSSSPPPSWQRPAGRRRMSESRQRPVPRRPSSGWPGILSLNDLTFGLLGSATRPLFSWMEAPRASSRMEDLEKSATSLNGGCNSGGCDNGLSNLVIFSVALAGAVFFLNQAITMGGKRRRKRKQLEDPADYLSADVLFKMADRSADALFNLAGKSSDSHCVDQEIKLAGLEDFEEKMEKLGQKESEMKDDNSWGGWLKYALNEFTRVKEEVQHEIEQEDETNRMDGEPMGAHVDDELDGIEPPILDPLWDAERDNIVKSVEEEKQKLGSQDGRVKRASTWTETGNGTETHQDQNGGKMDDQLTGGERCKIEVWRCLSGVLETGVKYLDKPGGIMGLAKKALFKIAFHGNGGGSVWTSLMSIPEARKVAKCFRKHDECLEYEIIAQEADNTEGGRRRLIINPEFVEGLDQSDGSEEYDYQDYEEDDKADHH